MRKSSSKHKKKAVHGDIDILKSVARVVVGNPIVEDPLPIKKKGTLARDVLDRKSKKSFNEKRSQ